MDYKMALLTGSHLPSEQLWIQSLLPSGLGIGQIAKESTVASRMGMSTTLSVEYVPPTKRTFPLPLAKGILSYRPKRPNLHCIGHFSSLDLVE